MIRNSIQFLQRTGCHLRFGPKSLPTLWRHSSADSPGLHTALQPLLAALAEAVHLGEVLGEIVLLVVLQVLLVALEQLGSTGL